MIFERIDGKQWRIQDFRKGSPTLGAPGYNVIQINQKLHEIKENWARGPPSVPPPLDPPLDNISVQESRNVAATKQLNITESSKKVYQ